MLAHILDKIADFEAIAFKKLSINFEENTQVGPKYVTDPIF